MSMEEKRKDVFQPVSAAFVENDHYVLELISSIQHDVLVYHFKNQRLCSLILFGYRNKSKSKSPLWLLTMLCIMSYAFDFEYNILRNLTSWTTLLGILNSHFYTVLAWSLILWLAHYKLVHIACTCCNMAPVFHFYCICVFMFVCKCKRLIMYI